MELNDSARVARSGSSMAGNRVSSRPPAMAAAAWATSATGRMSRVLAHRPTAAPATVVAMPAPSRATARKRSVRLSSSKEKTSKYWALTSGRGTPTARKVAPGAL